jgi:HPt (histidine-containing phosphotransfer) domain-containing protein
MTQNSGGRQNGKILVKADPDVADLIPDFLNNRRKDITVMLDALKRGDFETIRVLAHSMKGSGGGYGFDAITEVGRDLEQAAKSKNTEEIGKHISALSSYLDRVEVIYE